MVPLAILYCSALLLTLGLVTTCLAEIISLKTFQQSRASTPVKRSKSHIEYRFLPPIAASVGIDGDDEPELLDVVLLASVDGKFHALNRTSGRTIWSMSATAAPGLTPPTLGPLVRTTHVETDPEFTDDDSPNQELYIVEPQSGDIYVMSSPNSPLQRLSLSMSQLVNMSPFSFSGDHGRRTFIGKKETSLLLIDLETGKVKTLNSACPWDPFGDLHETPAAELDLDDLDGTTPVAEMSRPTEVFIGRTDYHLLIHTWPHRSSPNPPMQNLSFSTYGPNNQDSALQSTYRRTADDVYIQSLPNGDIFSLKAFAADGSEPHATPFLWYNKFSSPIVAVFDVLKAPGRQHPFVLLQPPPRLQDVLPGNIPNIASAYVGIVEETGSLFAMSRDRFPLVAFSNADSSSEDIGPGNLHADGDLSPGITEMCRNGSPNRTCLTGVRRLAEDSQSRFIGLLDGSSSVELPPEDAQDNPFFNNGVVATDSNDWSNLSIVPSWMWGPNNDYTPSRHAPLGLDGSTNSVSVIVSLTSALFFSVVWMFVRRFKVQKSRQTATTHSRADINGDETQTDVPSVQPPFVNSSSGMTTTEPPPPPLPPDPSVLSDSILPQPVNFDSQPQPNSKILENPADSRDDWEDSEREGDGTPVLGKRKGRRGRRGKKKKATVVGEDDENEKGKEKLPNGNIDISPMEPAPADFASIALVPPTPKLSAAGSSLVVSETILGYGSHGTVVFQGSLQGRSVAVKRLLRDFVTLASREVSILQESDDHPNVIRYYYQEAHANFLYIALELCPASLADIIENPDQFREISISFDPKRALRQIASGLRHLHALKIVHRDIKPQNILISSTKNGGRKGSSHRMLISDFGLCKKLDVDQTSFLPTAHGSMAAGTVGWRAPEILRGEVKLDDTIGDDQSQSSRGSVGLPNGGSLPGKPTRLTKSVDIFALGCLFYYTLTNGGHPFGDRFEREVNILKDTKNLEGLDRFGEEGSEAADLIRAMLRSEAHERPDTTTCLLHPFFWDSARRLTFLQDASDRFEIMCRDPRDPNLVTLEMDAASIIGHDWHTRLDKVFIENLGKFRKYDGKSVQDLLRALRNKKHHYQDLPDNVKRHLGSMPEGFLSYFTRRYPRLFLHVHSVVASTGLCQESMFKSYFDLVDS